VEEEERQRQQAIYKKQSIDVAEQRRNAAIDEVFGFVDQQSSDYSAYGPSAFQVCTVVFSRAVAYVWHRQVRGKREPWPWNVGFGDQSSNLIDSFSECLLDL